jgi:5-methylcytosine-specific restriction enzyme A
MPTRAAIACTDQRCPNTQPCAEHPTHTPWYGAGRAMPPGWASTRQRILARDPICRICSTHPGSGRPATEVHHLYGPGAEADTDLIGVCTPCHQAITLADAAAARWADR